MSLHVAEYKEKETQRATCRILDGAIEEVSIHPVLETVSYYIWPQAGLCQVSVSNYRAWSLQCETATLPDY